MGAQGTTTIDFGVFPGGSDTLIAVAQPAILAGSLVEAWIWPVATADHSADEHMVETLKIFAANVVAGVGFTIYGFNSSEINEAADPVVPGDVSIFTGSATAIGVKNASPGRRNHIPNSARGGIGTRIYGVWAIAWVWN